MKSKYYKTWEEIIEENKDSSEKNIRAMKKKMVKSEDIIFQFAMSLLL